MSDKAPGHDYYDDSSRALGLDHSATSGASIGSRRASGGIDAHFSPQEEAHRRITKELREKRRRELMGQGMTLRQATEQEQKEYDDPAVKRQLYDREGAHTRAIEQLADMRKKPPGHSSSSAKSKFKQRKTGTRVCPNCHLEGCQCYIGPGRPFEDGRSARVRASVRRGVKEKLASQGVSAGRVVQAVVDLSDSIGVDLDTVIRILESTKADPARVSGMFERARAVAGAA